MARRKRAAFDDDGLSDSSNSSDSENEVRPVEDDADARAERELFEDPYHRKKRRRNGGKEDAIYGDFAEEDVVDARGAGQRRRGKTKIPAFVSGQPTGIDVNEQLEEFDEALAEGDPASSDGESSERSGPEDQDPELDADSSDIELPEDKDTSQKLPSDSSTSNATPPASGGGIGMPGIGAAARGGIGSRIEHPGMPVAFGALPAEPRRPQRSFLNTPSTSSPKPAKALSAEEAMHFNKLQGTFGAKMLAKMGWSMGAGLGPDGQGIVTPIETKLRAAKAGIAHGGFNEKTKQSIREAQRKGEYVSDDEETLTSAQRKAKARNKQAKEERQQWKKPTSTKKKKIIVHHRTYEEIMEEVAPEASGAGIIIDHTGATPREVSSLTELSTAPWGATNDPTRLPELRHNLRLIGDQAKGELDGLAAEAKILQGRRKWIHDEDLRLRKVVLEEAELIERLQKMHVIADDLVSKAKEHANSQVTSLEPFAVPVMSLIQQYPDEYKTYHLDDIVVSAIAPLMKRLLSSWNPMEDPVFLASELRKWRKALRMSSVPSAETQVAEYGRFKIDVVIPKQQELVMTPYESLLWNVWLPRVRSCINNEWDPSNPAPLIQLIEAWSDVLPQFVRDNVFDQLIIPKLHSAIVDWSPKRSEGSLQSLVFPWLPFVGLRLESLVGDARRKVKNLFRAWTADQGIPIELMSWEKIFDAAEWEGMLLKQVVPKLGSCLREDFKINPRKQDMEPLNLVLAWSKYLRSSILGQLLETEFFPKWLNILYIWLIQPSANLEQVMQWYTFWKSAFPENIASMPRVAHGFTAGLQLMNNAMDLGQNAPKLLKKPDFKPLSLVNSIDKKKKSTNLGGSASVPEVTFRSIVEDYAAQHNLLFIPSGKTHERSRLPLYKVSPNVDGKGGVLVYIQDDAVWTAIDSESDWRAVGLEDMVLRATKGRK